MQAKDDRPSDEKAKIRHSYDVPVGVKAYLLVKIIAVIILLGIIIIISLFFVLIIKVIVDIIMSITRKRRREKAHCDEKRRLGFILKGSYLHASGLPLAENTKCTVYYFNDKIMIQGAGQTFNLSMSKISDISIISDVDIRKSYVSSVGGAVGGAVLFGPLGAMVGGRAKEKQVRTIRKYLVVTYKKHEGPAFTAFKLEGMHPVAIKIVNLFKNRPEIQGSPIEL